MKRRSMTVGILAALTLAAPTLAQDEADQYSAIAYSTTTHAVGYAYDAKTQDEAERAALVRCAEHADDCQALNWAQNACSALAIDSGGSGGWGAAWGDTYREAAINAHDTCLEYNSDCQVYAWVCNSAATPE